MLSRRGLGKAAAMGSFGAFGGLPPQRPDQIHTPRGPALGAGPRSTTFPILIVKGSRAGVFIYNAAGQLVDSMAFLARVDPLTRANAAGITNYDPGNSIVEIVNGGINLGTAKPPAVSFMVNNALIGFLDALTASSRPALTLFSPDTLPNVSAQLELFGESNDGTQPAEITSNAKLTVAGQITATSLADIVANGGLIAQTGDIIAQLGNLIANAVGKGLQIKSGANARIGTALLAGGTVTVANASVTASTLVFPVHHSIGPNAGTLGWSVNPGVSFTVTSTNAADANNINWLLVEQL